MLLTMEEIKAQLRLDEDSILMTVRQNWPEPEALCTG